MEQNIVTVGTIQKSNRKFKVQSIPLTQKYITFTFLAWHRHFNKKWWVKHSFMDPNRPSQWNDVFFNIWVKSQTLVSLKKYMPPPLPYRRGHIFFEWNKCLWTEAATDDVLPVQIQRKFNKLNTLIIHSLTTVPFSLSFCIHLFIPNIKVLTTWREVVRCSVHTSKFFSQF